MMAKTHTSFALALSLLPLIAFPEAKNFFIDSFSSFELVLFFFGLTIGSLFPDIDEPNSKISKSSIVSFLFSWIIRLLGVKHRGLTHKFIFLLFISMVLFFVYIYIFNTNYFLIFSVSFVFGVTAHHLGDMLSGSGRSKGGIYEYFFPLTRNIVVTIFPKQLRCSIGGIKEYLYFLLFNVFNVYALYQILNSKLIQLDFNQYNLLNS